MWSSPRLEIFEARSHLACSEVEPSSIFHYWRRKWGNILLSSFWHCAHLMCGPVWIRNIWLCYIVNYCSFNVCNTNILCFKVLHSDNRYLDQSSISHIRPSRARSRLSTTWLPHPVTDVSGPIREWDQTQAIKKSQLPVFPNHAR